MASVIVSFTRSYSLVSMYFLLLVKLSKLLLDKTCTRKIKNVLLATNIVSV